MSEPDRRCAAVRPDKQAGRPACMSLPIRRLVSII